MTSRIHTCRAQQPSAWFPCAQAKAVADQALVRLSAFNRRTLDTIAARIYYFYSLAYEMLGNLADIRR